MRRSRPIAYPKWSLRHKGGRIEQAVGDGGSEVGDDAIGVSVGAAQLGGTGEGGMTGKGGDPDRPLGPAGQVVLADTAENLLQNPLMREAYLGEL